MNGEQIPGFWLSFSPVEFDEIRATLEAEGYSGDHNGVKNFILDNLSGIDNDDGDGEKTGPPRGVFWDELNKYVKNNPEQVAGFMELGQAAFSKIARKKAGK